MYLIKKKRKNSLQFSADLGALDVHDQLVGLGAHVREVILELVHADLPGIPAVGLEQAASLAAWTSQENTHGGHEGHFKLIQEQLFIIFYFLLLVEEIFKINSGTRHSVKMFLFFSPCSLPSLVHFFPFFPNFSFLSYIPNPTDIYPPPFSF